MSLPARTFLYGCVTLLAAVLPLAGQSRNQLYAAPAGVEVHNMARDGHGLLWLATADGVYRFDGLHYQVIPGYPFKSAAYIQAADSGAVWAGGLEGLAVYRGNQWKRVLPDPVDAMAISAAGVWLSSGGLLRLIQPDGAAKTFGDAHPTGELTIDADGSVWFPCFQNACVLRPPAWHVETRPLPTSGSDWKKVLPVEGGRKLWLSSDAAVALEEGGTLREKQTVDQTYRKDAFTSLLDPYLGVDGSVFGTRLGLRRSKDLDVWSLTPVTENCSVTVDKVTRWFCAGERIGRSERGQDWETWAGGALSSAAAGGFLTRDRSAIPLVLTDRGIVQLDAKTEEWKRLAAAGMNDVLAAESDGFGGYWLATRDEGLLRTNENLEVQDRFPQLCSSVDTMRGLLRDGHGRMWAGGKVSNCFFEITGNPHHWNFKPQTLPAKTFQTVELHADSTGRPWVGFQEGLAYLDDSGKWRTIVTSEPVGMVRTFTFDGDGVIWVSHRQPGQFTQLTRNGSTWQVRPFEAKRYGPADTWYLRRDSRGWIWRGTAEGVFVAKHGHYEPGDWLRLTTQNGLAADGKTLQGWTEDAAGTVWLAGGGGITKLRPSLAWFAAPADRHPLITRVEANGQRWLAVDEMPSELPLSPKIAVDVSGMDANPFRSTPVRYRLAGEGAAWMDSPDGRIVLSELGTGNYTMEVAYNGDGETPVLPWRFQVADRTAAWRAGAMAAAIGLLGVLVWRRWDFLQYWVSKRFFLLGRAMEQDLAPAAAQGDTLNWRNYTGHTFAKRYHLLKPMARGGFSVAYLADDLQNDTKVVIKVLGRATGQGVWNRHRFAHEVAALHTVRHQGVVTLLDSWITPEGEPCLAMAFVDGPTLLQVLHAEGTLQPKRAARLVEQLGAALAAIHAPGIVHRDLKPENIIIQNAGMETEQAVIIDFGTAAARGAERDLEQTFTLTGSLHYLGPERLVNQYSAASDLYSFGVIVMEMLMGKRPADLQASPLDPAFSEEVAKFVGEELAIAIAEALHPDPARRPKLAEQWAKRCAALLRNSA